MSELFVYPIDLSALLEMSPNKAKILGISRVPSDVHAADHPTLIAQTALAHWNLYLEHGDETDRNAFLTRASWLLTHETKMANGAGVWAIPFALPEYYAPQPWLSALAQGSAISVLIRAYQLTSNEMFLQAAHRAVRPFELDILDGGVNTPLNEEGLFFEEVGVYPAAHTLSGYILALFGLYDYVTITQDDRIKILIHRSLTTLHTLFDEFDTGYWTRDDLLHRSLASRSSHALHVTLLTALAKLSGCEHCAALAKRWEGYQKRVTCRLRSRFGGSSATSKSRQASHSFRGWQTTISAKSKLEQVCIPIPQFPVPGGMKSVLAGVAQTMRDQWQMVYLTNYKGPDAEGLEIETFGRRITHPWQFPSVWLYSLAGFFKTLRFLHHNPNCRLVIPQDGIFTGAFAALVGKMVGVRVVCMDLGNITWLDNPALRQERMKDLLSYPWYKRISSRLRFACYWGSLPLLARISVHFSDLFFASGSDTEKVYRQRLGVHPYRIIRYAYMVDTSRFPLLEASSRTKLRATHAISKDAILITMVNRLASEKGVDIALAGIAQALAALPLDIRARVKVLIAGEGPLREQVQSDIQRYNLGEICILWGAANPAEVVDLLGISDIFLYCGTRAANYSVAVLEGMAAGCAVVASTVPSSNAELLAEGRGMAIAPGDTRAVAEALVSLCQDTNLCCQMGKMARNYIDNYHSPQVFKRDLLRATFFAPSVD